MQIIWEKGGKTKRYREDAFLNKLIYGEKKTNKINYVIIIAILCLNHILYEITVAKFQKKEINLKKICK